MITVTTEIWMDNLGRVRFKIKDNGLGNAPRAYIILTCLISIADSFSSPENIIHLWYSAFLPDSIGDYTD